MSVVRIGIIGVGVMGSAHVRSVSQLKNCTDFDTFVHLLIRQENSSISS